MNRKKLKEQIRGTFPKVPFEGPVTECGCDECREIQAALRNKAWDAVPEEFLDLTCSPTLLTPEAFRAFLPAYLVRALDLLGEDSNLVELTVYSLCPGDSEESDGMHRLQERARLMSPPQVQAIRGFLQFVMENAIDRGWLEPFIRRGLDSVWT